jgi:hypothetical protein
MSIDLNDTFLIHKTVSKNYYEYGKLQKKLIIADIKHLSIFTNNPYLFNIKARINNEITIQTRPDDDLLETLKIIAVGSTN